MTTELTSAWTVAMDEVTGDRSLRGVVVTGAGSAFCSGADLSRLDQGDHGDNTADIHESIRARREHRPPAFEGS